MCHSLSTTHDTPRSAAFTLVEMLIAMVLTLILVTAIAQFYAIVGDSVKDGRAMIEVGGQLRLAVERLKTDFDQITVNGVPWVDEGSAAGYFEYFEGRANDYNANGNLNGGVHIVDVSPAEDSNGNSTLDWLDEGATSGLGDGDDFIGFTIRSNGIPFTGRYTRPNTTVITSSNSSFQAGTSPQIVPSQLAEVVWWVGFDDLNNNRQWDWNEPRQLYRRQLLIRPDLGQLNRPGAFLDHYTQANLQTALQDLMWFWQYNDISASIRAEWGSSGEVVYRIRANSLSDLARREHRFGHMPVSLTLVNNVHVDTTFPHSAVTLASTPNIHLLLPAQSAKTAGGGTAGVTNSYVLQSPNRLPGENEGEDVLLSNLLAFDVQAYDPYARVWPDPSGSLAAITPTDPALASPTYASALSSVTPIGLGAFVDLNYWRHLPAAVRTRETNLTPATQFPLPYFADQPTVPPSLPSNQVATYLNNLAYQTANTNFLYGSTFDTWAMSYERDGIAQDFQGGLLDQGTDGMDNPNASGVAANGVDDAAERETAPPYPQSLRGLQVKIRVYEPSTRQVRQATVATDFVTE